MSILKKSAYTHRLLLGLLGIMVLLVLFISQPAYAASCADIKTSIISCSNDENGVWSIILMIIRILTAGVGIVAVGGIVYAALLYSTAEDKASQIIASKDKIRMVVIGLVLFAGLYSTIEFIVPGGVFNRSYTFPVSSSPSGNKGNGSNPSNGGEDKNGIREARMKIATYNVFGFNHDTSASRYPRNERMYRAANLLKNAGVDAFVATEINVNEQRSLLLSRLENWGATTRQSGNQDVFIFWNKDVFKLVNSGSYNIAVMPGRPSRPQPWVRLEHKQSQRNIFIFGAHLAQTSHGNNQVIGASTTVGRVKNVIESNKEFVAIVAGDMNTNDNRGYAYTTFKNSGILKDSRHATSNKIGENCDTHHNLGKQDCRSTRGSHIDHIWVTKKPKSTINSYRVVANDETAHISDHNPVIISITIPAPK